MVLQNCQNCIEMTSNMIYFVALAGGFKCPGKIHLNSLVTATSSGILKAKQKLGRTFNSALILQKFQN